MRRSRKSGPGAITSLRSGLPRSLRSLRNKALTRPGCGRAAASASRGLASRQLPGPSGRGAALVPVAPRKPRGLKKVGPSRPRPSSLGRPFGPGLARWPLGCPPPLRRAPSGRAGARRAWAGGRQARPGSPAVLLRLRPARRRARRGPPLSPLAVVCRPVCGGAALPAPVVARARCAPVCAVFGALAAPLAGCRPARCARGPARSLPRPSGGPCGPFSVVSGRGGCGAPVPCRPAARGLALCVAALSRGSVVADAALSLRSGRPPLRCAGGLASALRPPGASPGLYEAALFSTPIPALLDFGSLPPLCCGIGCSCEPLRSRISKTTTARPGLSTGSLPGRAVMMFHNQRRLP